MSKQIQKKDRNTITITFDPSVFNNYSDRKENLVQILGPKKDRSWSSPPNFGEEGLPIVKFACKKYLNDQEYKNVKIFRRSNFSNEAIINDFKKGNVPYIKLKRNKSYINSLSIVKKLFSPPQKLKPVHYCDLRYYPWTINTSVELPYSNMKAVKAIISKKWKEQKKKDISKRTMVDGKLTLNNCYNIVFGTNRNIIHQIKDNKFLKSSIDKKYKTKVPHSYYMKAHARSHLVENEEDDKIRAVNGVPKLILQVELMFLWPIMAWFRFEKTPILWGFETIRGGLYKMKAEIDSKSFHNFNTYVSVDWSAFDKHVLFSVLDDLYLILRSYLDFENGYQPSGKDYKSSETDPSRLENLWRWMCCASKYTPILLPDGSVYERSFAGLASGLLQTQVIGTMYNCLVLTYCLEAMGIPFNPKKDYLRALGDDSFMSFIAKWCIIKGGDKFLAEISFHAKKQFGQIMNLKKSKIQDTINGMPILGYTYQGIKPYKHPLKLLAQLMFPERYCSFDRLAARAIGIAYANMQNSKTVYLICKDIYDFCIKNGAKPDPLGLGMFFWLKHHVKIGIGRFPSFQETGKFIFHYSQRNIDLDEEFWPTWFFHEPINKKNFY
jgi:hypothetical protein